MITKCVQKAMLRGSMLALASMLIATSGHAQKTSTQAGQAPSGASAQQTPNQPSQDPTSANGESASGATANALDKTARQTGAMDQPASSGTTKAPSGTEPAGDAAAIAATAEAPTAAGGFIVEQRVDQIDTEQLIGTPVIDGTGERIGVVDDLIVSAEGMVKSLVIGVGGVLGLGQKHVELPWDQTDVTTAEGMVRAKPALADLRAIPDDETQQERPIGKDAVTPDQDEVGNIDGLLVESQGRVSAVILGIGGFLGLGQKQVALPIERVDLNPSRTIAMVDVNPASFERAPEYRSLEDRRAEQASDVTSARGTAVPVTSPRSSSALDQSHEAPRQ
ncbi:MAG: PRC-barrel domain-containing protein [Gammaproteobacteria bacterium]|nr:PRC-barrel domain-containing protein [Gammaproteobacteria bacterium]